MTHFQFPPRSTRGSVLGFSWGQIGTAVAGVICLVIAANLLTVGRQGAAGGMVLLSLLLITVGLLRLRGRRVTEWTPIVVGALVQRAARQDRYRGGAFAASPGAEHLHLPGPAAGYRWVPALAADGLTEVGLLHHRREGTVTAALICAGSNLVLADTSVQQQRLASWADVLNLLGTEYADSGLVRWSLTARAVPDTGNRAQRYLVQRAVDTSSPAYESLAELTAAAAPSTQRHEVYLAVVFDLKRLSAEIADAGGTDAAIATVILDKLAGIDTSVRESGVETGGWLTPRAYAAVLRTQFDPQDQPHVDMRAGTQAGVAPHMGGPVAAENIGWSSYRHDSGVSQTLWVYEMPRQPVAMTWITALYTRTVGRRAVTVVAEPVPAQLAQLATRRDKVARAGDEVTKRKMRLVRTAREDEEARSVEQIDREQAAGHVRYRYSVLVTVTADSEEQLRHDVRAIKRVLGRAGCQAVVLYGEQDQGFVAGALPLARGLKPIRGWAA
ncbi:SCO6880 family protein [Micromonospora sp. CPCC 205558]|uniref:SCO6880 family protein n=1 Tax=Micromonospora sp. CPCC 205558 TaxID=3122403 RepID=UPI002FF40A86